MSSTGFWTDFSHSCHRLRSKTHKKQQQQTIYLEAVKSEMRGRRKCANLSMSFEDVLTRLSNSPRKVRNRSAGRETL